MPGTCPNCKILLYPIFNENNNIYAHTHVTKDFTVPNISQEELSNAIIETIDAGARIINLSLGSSSFTIFPKLRDAYDYAVKKDTIRSNGSRK